MPLGHTGPYVKQNCPPYTAPIHTCGLYGPLIGHGPCMEKALPLQPPKRQWDPPGLYATI